MKRRTLLIIPALIAVAIMIGCSGTEKRPAQTQTSTRTPATQPQMTTQEPLQPVPSHSTHAQPPSTEGPRIPAYLKSPPSKASLAPTLDPQQFTGPTRAAYQAVREIPQTIAQLPCYCYCDEGFGHKSLYSCFEDDHGAHCAVCVNEVLMAYRMEKEMGMTPAQIRERIVAQYSRQH